MAKRIVVLERLEPGKFRYALWADVPVPRQPFYAKAGAVSVWSGASAGENAAIASGAIAEKVDLLSFIVPQGQSGVVTLANAQAHLEAAWTAFQAEVAARNDWIRYGSFWDGTTWTMTGVA